MPNRRSKQQDHLRMTDSTGSNNHLGSHWRLTWIILKLVLGCIWWLVGGDSPSPVADWNPAGIHNSLSLSGRPTRLLSLTDRPGFPDLGRLLLSPPTDYPTLHIPQWSRSRSESLLSFSTAAKSIKLDRKHGK